MSSHSVLSMIYQRNLPTPSLFQRLQSFLIDSPHFIFRMLNVTSKWWTFEMGFAAGDDLEKIRNEAPLRGIILDAEEPVEVSPAVYLMWGHPIGEQRMMRYTCSVLGNRIIIERL